LSREVTVADEEKPATHLDRQQVISLIAKHAKELASLAKQQGCMSLHHLLRMAAEQAEQDLVTPRAKDKSNPS
jgi:hypothetical protein